MSIRTPHPKIMELVGLSFVAVGVLAMGWLVVERVWRLLF